MVKGDRPFWATMAAAALLGLATGPAHRGATDEELAAGRAGQPLAIRVSVSEQRVQVLRDGAVLRTYRLMSDPGSHVPPKGSFQIRRLVWTPAWAPPDTRRPRRPAGRGQAWRPAGRVRIPFREPGYTIHGASDSSPGGAPTHRCIRLRQEDTLDLARLILNEPGEPRRPTWLRRVLHGATGTTEVRLARPVPLTVS